MEFISTSSWVLYAAGGASVVLLLAGIATLIQPGRASISASVLVMLLAAALGAVAYDDYVAGWQVNTQGVKEIRFLRDGTTIQWQNVTAASYEHYRYTDPRGTEKVAEILQLTLTSGATDRLDLTAWSDAEVATLAKTVAGYVPSYRLQPSKYELSQQMTRRGLTSTEVREM